MNKLSKETQEQALKVSKATQRPNQTKEQTKLIAQGIEKGIAEYKKQQSKKSRERDKIRKSKLKASVDQPAIINEANNSNSNLFPWILLIVSWIGFIGWYLY